MHKRLLIALFMIATLTLGVAQVSKVSGAKLEAPEPVASTPAPDGDSPKKSGGNAFARAFKAPFKAIGRLFGKGGKDENKIERLSEKDVKKFETTAMTRVVDATTPPAPAPPPAESEAAELVSMGREALARNSLNEAVTLLTRAASVDPRLAEAHRLAGQAYARMRLYEQASLSLRRAVDLTPKDAQTLNDYGYALHLAGDHERAVKYLKRAAKHAPRNQRVWNNLAAAQARAGKFDDAFESFARAVGEFSAHVNVAKMLVRAGRDRDAIRHYEQARRVAPPTPDLLRQLAGLYERTGRPEEAEAARRQMVTADNGAPKPGGN
jgi:Flp pilus assembly protein TadD